MVQKQLVLRIYNDGRIVAETHNIKGKKCTKYAKVLEELCDAKVTESSYTREYYEEENELYYEDLNKSDIKNNV